MTLMSGASENFIPLLAARVRRLPMVVLTTVFAAGIIFFHHFWMPAAALWAVLVSGCVAAVLFPRSSAARGALAVALFAFGGVVWQIHGDTTDASRKWMHDGERVHAVASERFSRLELSPSVAAVAGAMGAGDRSRMTPELRKAYSRSGVSHILAVSGLHIGIVFLLANALCRLLTIFRHGQIVACAAVLVPVWLYAAACGLSPSVVRAAAMFSMLQLSMALSSSYRSPNVLAAAAFLMLAFDPAALFDISFQLSFAAVTAIVAAGIPLFGIAAGRSFAERFLWETFVIGCTAFVATAPLVAHCFGELSLAGVLLNPLVIICAYATVAVSVVWMTAPLPFLQPAVEWVLDFTVGIQNRAVEILSSYEWLRFDVQPDAWSTAAVYLLLAAAITAINVLDGKIKEKRNDYARGV